MSKYLNHIKDIYDSIVMKILTSILLLLLLNGCFQNTAFFGPAVTIASTGNVYQAGLSYGSNAAVSKLTGKSTFENVQEILAPKKNDTKVVKSVKKKIVSVSKINNPSSQ